jgi:hypothetical protein
MKVSTLGSSISCLILYANYLTDLTAFCYVGTVQCMQTIEQRLIPVGT